MGVSSIPDVNITDIANLTEISRKLHKTCVSVDPDQPLEHGNTYYTIVWAYNGAIKQQKVVSMSDGGKNHIMIKQNHIMIKQSLVWRLLNLFVEFVFKGCLLLIFYHFWSDS